MIVFFFYRIGFSIFVTSIRVETIVASQALLNLSRSDLFLALWFDNSQKGAGDDGGDEAATTWDGDGDGDGEVVHGSSSPSRHQLIEPVKFRCQIRCASMKVAPFRHHDGIVFVCVYGAKIKTVTFRWRSGCDGIKMGSFRHRDGLACRISKREASLCSLIFQRGLCWGKWSKFKITVESTWSDVEAPHETIYFWCCPFTSDHMGV